MTRKGMVRGKHYSFFGSTSLITRAILQATLLSSCYGLYCWKCISESCYLQPNDVSRAVKVSCQKGQSCVKALYQMGQTPARYRSVIRTCSAGSCVPMAEDEFRNCSSNPRKYNVTGCALRLCCNDQDLCNGTRQKESTIFDIRLSALLLVLLMSLL